MAGLFLFLFLGVLVLVLVLDLLPRLPGAMAMALLATSTVRRDAALLLKLMQ